MWNMGIVLKDWHFCLIYPAVPLCTMHEIRAGLYVKNFHNIPTSPCARFKMTVATMCSPCAHIGSLWVLWFPSTHQNICMSG